MVIGDKLHIIICNLCLLKTQVMIDQSKKTAVIPPAVFVYVILFQLIAYFLPSIFIKSTGNKVIV